MLKSLLRCAHRHRLAESEGRRSPFGWFLLACLISAGNAFARYAVQPQLERLARDPVVPVRRDGPARRRVHAARSTSMCGSTSSTAATAARPRHWVDLLGHDLLPDAGDAADLAWMSWPLFVDSWQIGRNVEQRGRADPLAGEAPDAARLRPAGAAGLSEIIKRIALPARHRYDDGHALRAAAAMITMREHGAADVRGPRVRHADRLSGRVLAGGAGSAASASSASSSASSRRTSCRRCRCACSASCPNDLLLAIPFFTFMGAILERCGLAEDLLEGTGQLFGAVPGGLAYAVIFVGAMLGAITGTVAASVIAMGLISLPIMMRYGYNMRLATGVIAASGTITQLIPPSLVLVVLADQLGRSVGDMYTGAIGPSIVQVAVFLLFICWLSIVPARNMSAAAGRGAHADAAGRSGATRAVGHGAVDRR